MRVKALYDLICPKCGTRGQLKKEYDRYYYVDHYKFRGSFRHGTWISRCYIGKVLLEKY